MDLKTLKLKVVIAVYYKLKKQYQEKFGSCKKKLKLTKYMLLALTI